MFRFVLLISVTRWWNKKLPNFPRKLPKKLPHTFYTIVILLVIAQKGTKIVGLLLWDNMSPRTCKNRPIWVTLIPTEANRGSILTWMTSFMRALSVDIFAFFMTETDGPTHVTNTNLDLLLISSPVWRKKPNVSGLIHIGTQITLRNQELGCCNSSVDSSAPTILGLSPKHTIYAFIIYSICAIFVMWKGRK